MYYQFSILLLFQLLNKCLQATRVSLSLRTPIFHLIWHCVHSVCTSDIVSVLLRRILFQVFRDSVTAVFAPLDSQSDRIMNQIAVYAGIYIFNRLNRIPVRSVCYQKSCVQCHNTKIPACNSPLCSQAVLLVSELPWICPLAEIAGQLVEFDLHSRDSSINTTVPGKIYKI